MKSKLEVFQIRNSGIVTYYNRLMFICPGCALFGEARGLHSLPVNTDLISPAWTWNGDLEKPTLNPSILSGKDSADICHSFLKDGVFQFLTDSTHSLSGQYVEMPDLPDWVAK